MKFTEEDIKFVKKAIEIRDKGYYIQSQTLTKYYNKILGKNAPNTTCGSCCRGRITELQNALKQWEKQQAEKEAAKKAEEETKVAEVDNIPQETKEAVTEQIKEAQDNAEETEEEAEVENVCDELVIEEVKEEPKNEPVTQRTVKKRKTSKPKANR